MSHNAAWIIVALVAIFALAVIGRWRASRPRRDDSPTRARRPEPPPIEPLRPGESYDDSAKLATVPNAPLADLWCQRLRAEGIEAFYKPTPYLAGVYGAYGSAAGNPGLPVEIWVGEHSLARARELFPELA